MMNWWVTFLLFNFMIGMRITLPVIIGVKERNRMAAQIAFIFLCIAFFSGPLLFFIGGPILVRADELECGAKH
ncbi:hypothetical protein J2X61_000542 [Bacillus sp. 3255]|nr:hypothetical protein [Bacillus sp. 3255]